MRECVRFPLRSLIAIGALAAIVACAESAPHREAVPVASPTLLDAPGQTIPRGGITINYRSIGSGEPVLLIHGYGDNLTMWAGLGDSLAAAYRVIAVDTRGFGRSSKTGRRRKLRPRNGATRRRSWTC